MSLGEEPQILICQRNCIQIIEWIIYSCYEADELRWCGCVGALEEMVISVQMHGANLLLL